MFKISLFLLLAGCAVDEFSSDQQALLDGTPTNLHPEIMQISTPPDHNGKTWNCTGTMISPTTFLSAAHCFDFAPVSRGGSIRYLLSNGLSTTVGIDRTFAQGGELGNDDLVVGRTLMPITSITPATISASEPVLDDNLTIVGYGCTGSRDDQCGPSAAREYTTYEYVGGNTSRTSHGDSGGPTFLGSLDQTGPIPIIRVTSGWEDWSGFDIGADAVAYRSQILALSTALQSSGVSYRSQVQGLGWTAATSNDGVSGTTGQSRRLEGLQVWTQNTNQSICYSAFVQDHGWQTEVCDGALAGTVGQALRMEAVKIHLIGGTGVVRYRTYLQDLGWQPWVENNTISGTTGQSRRIEAIQIDFPRVVIIPPGGGGLN